MKKTFSILVATFGRYRWHVGALAIFGIVSPLLEGIGINAIIPLMSFFMGGGIASNPINEMVQNLFEFLHIPFSFRYLLGFILILFFLRAGSVIVFGYIRAWINADFLGKESEDIMRRTLLSSWAFSLRQKIGTMHNSLVRDVQQTGGLLGAIIQTIQSFSGFLMYLFVAINISPLMTIYAVGGGAVLVVALRPFLKRTERIGRQAAGVEKQFSQFLSEHIIGMKSVKAAGVENAAIHSGSNHIRLLRHLSIKQSFIGTISSSFFQPAALVLAVVLFLLTYNTPQFNVVSFTASLYLIQKIFAYLESGQNSMQSVSAYLPYATSLQVFKNNLDKHRESFEGHQPFVLKQGIQFKHISFNYDEQKQVLHDVNFSIRTGEIFGIIGPSGAGKTSVVDLILRLFRPTSGTILLDEVPCNDIPLDVWRKNIGYVSQDVFLMHDTIEENIRFYNDALTKDDIERAAKQANIYDFIIGLPEGFKTVTGDRGVMLSGGQRQRIALARALAGKPALLVLDEATSALDHESENLIKRSIMDLRGVMTVILIAHRPSTIADANMIIVLDHGHIVEQGSPQELMKNTSSYFFRMQQKSGSEEYAS